MEINKEFMHEIKMINEQNDGLKSFFEASIENTSKIEEEEKSKDEEPTALINAIKLATDDVF